MCQSTWTARTEYHRLVGFGSRSVYPHSSVGCKPKIKVFLGLVSGEASLSDSQTATFLLCPHVACPLRMWRERVRESLQCSPSSYKDTRPIG